MHNLITITTPFKLLRCQWALPTKSIASNSNRAPAGFAFGLLRASYFWTFTGFASEHMMDLGQLWFCLSLSLSFLSLFLFLFLYLFLSLSISLYFSTLAAHLNVPNTPPTIIATIATMHVIQSACIHLTHLCCFRPATIPLTCPQPTSTTPAIIAIIHV